MDNFNPNRESQQEYFGKGNTRKIAELPEICRSKEHNPPMFQYFENGMYEHVCPACGHRTVFTVNNPTF
jgi:hypothetical protein